MRTIFTFLFISTLLNFILLPNSACRKESIGGTIRTELCVTTQHHERPIPGIKIFLKYNTEVFPGYGDTTGFDASFTTDRYGYRCFSNLPLGKHWLVGYGLDSLLDEKVRGSVAIEIGLTSAQKDTILYVSEY